MASIDDQLILEDLRKQTPRAWENLILAYGNQVYGVALRILSHEKDAEDAVQEVWLTVSAKLTDFRGDAKLSTWLYRVTVNKCLEKVRARKRRRTETIEDRLPEFEGDGHFRQQFVDWSQKPALTLENRLLREEIEKALNSLPEEYRQVIILRDIEGLSGQETAEILEIGLAAVKTRLHRARAFVREKLSRKYGVKPWFMLLRMVVL